MEVGKFHVEVLEIASENMKAMFLTVFCLTLTLKLCVAEIEKSGACFVFLGRVSPESPLQKWIVTETD
jgi:hypothetical protein